MLYDKRGRQFEGAQNFLENASNCVCVVPSDVKYACDLNPRKERSQKDKDRYLFQRSQEAAEKREKDFARRELESMLPFKDYAENLCEPIEDCSSKSKENPKGLRKNKFCPIEVANVFAL